jgi:hypothetical protein
MAELNLEQIIKSGVEKALNKPIMNGKSIMEWAAIGMKAPRWISVKDGKPPSIREPRYRDAFRPVFLYTKKDNSVYVGWYLGEDYRGIDCYISRTSMKSYQHITKKITHWMPLPELPEEETQCQTLTP